MSRKKQPTPVATRKEKMKSFVRKTVNATKDAKQIAKFAVRHPMLTNDILKTDFPGTHAAGALVASALAKHYLLGPFLENLAANSSNVIDLDDVAKPMRRRIIRQMEPLGPGSYIYKGKVVMVKDPGKVFEIGRKSFIRSFGKKPK